MSKPRYCLNAPFPNTAWKQNSRETAIRRMMALMTRGMGRRRLADYRCATILLIFAAHAAVSASTFKVLSSFDGTNGALPSSRLIQGLDGNLYGTAEDSGYDAGRVFRISPSGTLTTIYKFCSQANCADGSFPSAPLVLGTDGNFYGTTYLGGSTANPGCFSGCGTIFKITPQGKLTTLHEFCEHPSCLDGYSANYGLVEGPDGDFYGVAWQGGANFFGTVFKISPKGAFTTLHAFCAASLCTDGGLPNAQLALGSNGAFYGTTESGGHNSCGEVFQITASGVLTVLHSFACGASGESPNGESQGRLVQASDGDFYGVTETGGTHRCSANGCGTVYKMTPSGTLTTLVDFDGTNGSLPFDGLVQGSDGNFYGTTTDGATKDSGTIFEMTPSGKLTTLYDLPCGCEDDTSKSVFQATNGIFYGTVESGGDEGNGIIFSLSTGLQRFVETLPTSGKVGTAVTILGEDFTGATAVDFNGKAATFKVNSATEITTTVPAGATTGNVSVKLSTGSIVSTDLQFRVP